MWRPCTLVCHVNGLSCTDMTAVDTIGGEERRMRTMGVLLGFAALAFGLLLAGPADAQDVKIGILFGVTGQFASFAPPLLDAVKLAVDEVNANGGILKGQKLEMVLGDTKGTGQGGIDAARK